MSEQHQAKNVHVNNELSLQKLSWTIQAAVGQFKLIFARCNYAQLRDSLISRLSEICPVELSILYLKPSDRTLHTAIREEFGDNVQALMIVGLETLQDLPQMLTSANQVREEFRQSFSFPLVLWINDEVYTQLMQLAPDLESWATTRDFPLPNNELTNFIEQIATELFTNTFNLTKEKFIEIQLACQDLQCSGQVLEPELKANFDFILGFIAAINKNFDTAIEYYRQSLAFWQENNNLEWQGITLSQITLCYYEKSQQLEVTKSLASLPEPEIVEKLPNSIEEENQGAVKEEIHQLIGNYLQQSLEAFEFANRPDLIADAIAQFGIILRYLQDWQQLQMLAERALGVHEAEENTMKIAQDYSFLAEVALARKNWELAQDLAQKALAVLPGANQSAQEELIDVAAIYQRQELLLILSISQQHLEQYQPAISNLESGKSLGVLNNEPKLYLKILGKLQKLLFQQKEYLKAFDTKLTARSIEQQFGLRAFIGAGRLQAAKQIKKPGIASLKVENQDGIAPGIAASGRQLDVERLIERIGRLDYKLIVIHGQSGVGKSSLVNAGLVPALKNKSIGVQDNLVVAMRVYTNWVEELSRLLLEALREVRGSGEVREQDSNGESVIAVSGLDLGVQTSYASEFGNTILTQIREHEQHNLRTVLIFDQFEEFFFVYTEPQQRRQFFEFLGKCLNILSVKVILSLRVDYLHYLLECNRLPTMRIIGNDILSNNVLYELGNFSPDDAKSIIQRLTENTAFYLESALVEQLVQDLAAELGQVRPIELQVVGAQLQTENIKTLAQYQQCGRHAKEELVKRYLAEVVDDCGAENKQAAELLLYLLTDEKGTRPIKTRAELERDLQALAADVTTEANKLDLVLEIFVKSGLVVLLPENPFDRYQLVHDYLAAFIRQQQPKLNELMAELERERKQRKQSEDRFILLTEQIQQASQILSKAQVRAKQEPLRRRILPIWKDILIAIKLALLFSTLVIFLRYLGLLQSLELTVLDQFFHLRPSEKPNNRITIVAIDEASLRQGFPIPDGVIAELLQKIQAHQPRAIGLDIYRDVPIKYGYIELANAYQSMPNLIGVQLLAPKGQEGVLAPPKLNPQQVGFNNIVYDPDGKVRRSLPYWWKGNEQHESFALKLASLYLKTEGIFPKGAANNPKYLQLGRAVFTRFTGNDGAYVGIDARGYQILSNFPKRSCETATKNHCNYQQVSMADVLADKVPASLIKDRVVLIGSTAASIKEGVWTPYSSRLISGAEPTPGIVLQAYFVDQLISAAIDGRPLLQAWPDVWEYFWIFICSGCVCILIGRSCSFIEDIFSFILVFIFFTFVVVSAYFAFCYGLWIPLIPSLISMLTTGLIAAINNIKVTKYELEEFQLRRTLDLIFEMSYDNPIIGCLSIEYLINQNKDSKKIAQNIIDVAIQALSSYKTSDEIIAMVLFACEKAVHLSPNNGSVLDKRGIARVMTGNYHGAIADFEAYICSSRNVVSNQVRQRWIKDLKNGINPLSITDSEHLLD